MAMKTDFDAGLSGVAAGWLSRFDGGMYALSTTTLPLKVWFKV